MPQADEGAVSFVNHSRQQNHAIEMSIMKEAVIQDVYSVRMSNRLKAPPPHAPHPTPKRILSRTGLSAAILCSTGINRQPF